MSEILINASPLGKKHFCPIGQKCMKRNKLIDVRMNNMNSTISFYSDQWSVVLTTKAANSHWQLLASLKNQAILDIQSLSNLLLGLWYPQVYFH